MEVLNINKKKSEITKENILNSAIDIFIRDGYSAARTIQIAKEAGVAEGTVFKYFKSKKGLLDEIVLTFFNAFTEKILIDPLKDIFENNKDKEPIIVLKKILLNRIELLEKYKRYAYITFAESRFDEEIKKTIMEKVFPEVKSFGIVFFEHYKEKGIFRKDLDSWIALRTGMSIVIGIIVSKNILKENSSNLPLDKELNEVLDIFLRGLIS